LAYLRQRKDRMGEKRYSISSMNDSLKLSETSVESILKSTPKAVRFFLDWQTACAGCNFARFCTLKDVVATYHFDEKKFLEEIEKLNVQKS
jgi:hypothetical protein